MVAINRLRTPKQIVRHLDQHVIGQRHAKQRLSMAVYHHYLGLRLRDLPDGSPRDFGRQHVLLLGPTGVGKTLLVKTLAAFLGVPVAFTAATSLVETGYVGSPVESIFAALLERANGDARLAEAGIVFLDEFDKLKRARDIGRDVSGEGVQNGLLTLLDGRMVRLRWRDKEVALDSSRTLFLCTGAFAGLADVVRAREVRRARQVLGFTAPAQALAPAAAVPTSDTADMHDRVTADDLVQYGFIPELVARFGDVVALRVLSDAELDRVLGDLPNSPLMQKQRFFEMHGVRMQVCSEARRAMVDRARQQGLGARTLDRVVRDVFSTVDFELPDLRARGFGAVRITPEMVAGTGEAVLIPLSELPDWEPPSPSAEQLRNGGVPRHPMLPRVADAMRERQQRQEAPAADAAEDAASEPRPERRKTPRSEPERGAGADGPTLFDPES